MARVWRRKEGCPIVKHLLELFVQFGSKERGEASARIHGLRYDHVDGRTNVTVARSFPEDIVESPQQLDVIDRLWVRGEER